MDKLKVALGLSGGIDSLACYHMAVKNNITVTPIYFNYGQPYANKEIQVLRNLGIDAPIVKFDLYQPTNSATDYMIPARNLYFVTYLSSIADTVWIGGTKDNNSAWNTDKNDGFYQRASEILSYIHKRQITVTSPIKNLTKEMLGRWLIQHDLTHLLTQSVSCYSDTRSHCGRCYACVKKYVLLRELQIQHNFDFNPAQSTVAVNLVQQLQQCLKIKDFTRYSESRAKQLLKILQNP